MKKNEKHIYLSDKIAILICLVMAIYSIIIYKQDSAVFVIYYFLILLFRIIVLFLQNLIVRKNDDDLKKFKKERFLCRFVGILLIVVDLAFIYMLLVQGIIKNYDTVNKYPWLMAGYGLYAVYKLIAAIIGFKKSRKSVSPYRDIMTALNYLDAMFSFMSLVFMIWQPTVDPVTGNTTMGIQIYFAIPLAITSLIVTLKVIFSRRIPKSLKNLSQNTFQKDNE